MHLLTIDQFNTEQIFAIFNIASKLLDNNGNICRNNLLKDFHIAQLFFENSTRTKVSFACAANNLRANIIDLNIATSSIQKGEDIISTLENLYMMGIKIFILRHGQNNILQDLANKIKYKCILINAGTGSASHPTQALLDAYTIWHYKHDFANLKIAIVGDILHSRVAQSQLKIFRLLGVKQINLVAPEQLVSQKLTNTDQNIHIFHDLAQGINDCDVVIGLRVQFERMQQQQKLLPSIDNYSQNFCLNSHNIMHAKSDAIMMHPGPVNKGIDISEELLSHKRTVILQQVKFGVITRMALLQWLVQNTF